MSMRITATADNNFAFILLVIGRCRNEIEKIYRTAKTRSDGLARGGIYIEWSHGDLNPKFNHAMVA